MRPFERLRHVLPIEPGEGPRVAWLALHSLCNGLFVAFFFSAANALFLDTWATEFLPWAYVGSSIAGYLLIRTFAQLENRASLATFSTASLGFLLTVALGAWLLLASSGDAWIPFVVFLLAGPCLALLEVEFWGLASNLFDLSQGKRLFGAVSTGEVVSSIVGFFLVPVLVDVLASPVPLLGVAAAGAFAALLVARYVTYRFAGLLARSGEAAEPERPAGGRGAGGGAWSRYLVLMAALMVAFVFAFYLLDLGFLSQVSERFDGNALAKFFGVFYGSIKVLELVGRPFLGSRLVHRFGLRLGLLLLPAALLVTGTGAVAVGFAAGPAVAAFFQLVAFSKLLWLILRKSVFDPSFRVLYQPLPPRDRVAAQARLGAVSQASGLAASLGLVAYASRGVHVLGLLSALVPVLCLWIGLVLWLHPEYRRKLLANLSERSSVRRSGATDERIVAALLAAPPEALEGDLRLLERVDPDLSRRCLHELARTGGPEARGIVEAHQARQRTGTALDLDSEGGEARLAELLRDRDLRVRRAALLAAGRRGDRAFWPRILAALSEPALSAAAAAAAVAVGEPLFDDLERAFQRASRDREARGRILRIYTRIGGDKARSRLFEALDIPDRRIFRRALEALTALGLHPTPEQAARLVRWVELTLEINARNLAGLVDLRGSEPLAAVRAALEDEIEINRSILFGLLELLHDAQAVALIREHVESDRRDAVDYALELADLVISPELKPVVLPALERLPPAQALARLQGPFPQSELSPYERLRELVNRDHARLGPWPRACALEALGRLSEGRSPDDLVAHLFNPEPMQQEVAAWALQQVSPGELGHHLAKLRHDGRRLARLLGLDEDRPETEGEGAGDGRWWTHSIYGRVRLLREMPFFAPVPVDALAGLAQRCQDCFLAPGESLPSAENPARCTYVVAAGTLEGVGAETLSRGDIVPMGRREPLRAREPCRLLRLDPEHALENLADYPELTLAFLAAPPPTSATQEAGGQAAARAALSESFFEV